MPTRFGLNGYELMLVAGFQFLPQLRFIDFLRSSSHLKRMIGRHENPPEWEPGNAAVASIIPLTDAVRDSRGCVFALHLPIDPPQQPP